MRWRCRLGCPKARQLPARCCLAERKEPGRAIFVSVLKDASARRAMDNSATGWTRGASELTGPRFAGFQIALTAYNSRRLEPALPEEAALRDLDIENAVMHAEINFIEAQRRLI